MMLLDLPVDMWFALMEYLSLGDFAMLYTALSTTPFDFTNVKQFAINAISRILVSGNPCTSHLTFAYNGPCYKFYRKLPRAATTYHERVHGKDPPCGGEYRTYCTVEHTRRLRMGPGIKLSRTFRSAADKRTTEMTLWSNDGKPFGEDDHLRWFFDRPNRGNTGPRELVIADFDFSSNSDPKSPFLRFSTDTLDWVDILNTHTDVRQPNTSSVLRTVSHLIPLQKVMWNEWVEDRWKSTELPWEWCEFWSSSGIRGVGTFKANFVGEYGGYWRWKLESFKSDWTIPMPLSSCVEVVELDI
jgi:hypothetical protein